MRQIFGAIAECEKTMIVLKLHGARQRARARDGRCEGAKPFGSLPGEAEVLQRIKAMQAAGETGYSIANRLNAEGIVSRLGTKWHPYAARQYTNSVLLQSPVSRSGHSNCQPHRYHLGVTGEVRHWIWA
jgi:hypothetical protein